MPYDIVCKAHPSNTLYYYLLSANIIPIMLIIMRLPKLGFSRVNNTSSAQINNRQLILKLLIALILIAALALAWQWHHHKANSYSNAANAAQEGINSLKNSKELIDRRSLISDYIAAGDYSKAEETAKAVAAQTGSANDYMSLLNICTIRKVADKNDCVSLAVSKLKPQVSQLDFFTAYSIGSELDESGFKKDAVAFYQRAYDSYDPSRADAYTKTKDQIKQRIDELSK